LLNYGFRKEHVVVAHPDHLDSVVGPGTKVVALTEFDPLGMGPATLIIGLPKEDEEDIDLTIQLVERLREFKSLIVPLFFISEGSLASKAESFTIERMNRTHGELFVKCWKHDLKWIPTLLKEYSGMCLETGLKRYGLRFIASLGIRYADCLFSMCQEEYDYDLAQMIKDIRAGRIRVAPSLLKLSQMMSSQRQAA